MKIYTIGHSTRSLKEFIEILKAFNIEQVIDVRRLPRSRKFPHFNKENLEAELSKVGIQYVHLPELGGYRKEGYLAFSQTEEFANAIKKLLKIINEKTAVVLCAEILWWRCHRRYIANALAQMGHQIIHIFDEKKTQEHKSRNKETEKNRN
ncbi:MAG: DUF488 domain-containing protein [Candidatus Bathyarchaeia archaeon]